MRIFFTKANVILEHRHARFHGDPLFKLTAPESRAYGWGRRSALAAPCAPSCTHQALLLVPDGLGVVPHEAHSEDKVEDSEDGVQPEKVVAGGGGGPAAIGAGLPSRGGGAGLRPGSPHGAELRVSGSIPADASNRGLVASAPLEQALS